ncbi:MAG TPA: DedA family protein [Sphingobacterium sp.]|nr:DedA family protein [Sphingobacterium sp.]
MELISGLFDFIIHIDQHLVDIVNTYQSWTYLILFLIIFAETGLVVTPFLPGDSLLFAIGAIIANPNSDLNIMLMWVLLIVAGILGDWANYHIGQYLGPKAFSGKYKLLKKEYLDKTEEFYKKYGGRTIIYARFVPIIRTFAPFVAGIGSMRYGRFAIFNISGAILWVSIFLFLGYFIGSNPVVQNNFTLIIFGIIFISLLPPLIATLKEKRKSARKS